ncbi:MAG: UDP-N-acetylglucosamine--N-acetylmuramyl-(pentapeptide) pyrophosphoryl-undecaprenol N-acetylglucosamine transferase [Candidatus Methanoperedens sp.]|nr:UDP-N-acetylglucosamine--N-acetylmuramyl-(pentapeptide) pyrophosphoryl-undecaprenol N-acetylglucosamine transferase [Candidatus Methanoperedens sp.]MCZ7394457.1 UDP-N-acetylglucosamine--N-acetylmuramyl-(pentapeptide) pyrophosphoryl-undecaprenol N-acetylglucosamine transferase [Candidatus Methanoperedens sp.]
MAHRIFFSVCGEGYGHSSRDMVIAESLTGAGSEVLMGSYGYVLDRLKKSFNAVEIKNEFEMVGKEGTFDLKGTISRSSSTAIHFSKTISDEKKIMEEFGATCVVSDGRIASVLAAFKLGLPCIMISNQTSLEPFFKDETFFLRLVGKPMELMMKTTMSLTDEVLIPDFPPPHTVCINTLSKSRHIMKKQRFIGPVVSMNGVSQQNIPDMPEKPFVVTILGGHSFRLPIFNGILKIADRFPDFDFLIFTKFKSENIPKNVKVMGFAEDISSYMQGAELIVTQAGHSTAMEILTLGKPALIIPDKGQIEQESNAARMKELGICETLDYASLDTESFFEKINLLLNDSGFGERAKQYAEMAKKMEGCKKAADIISGLSDRIQCY